MRNLRKWGGIVWIIITVAVLAITLTLVTPYVKRYQANLNATKLLAVVSTNNPIPKDMAWFTVWGQDVAIWVVANATVSGGKTTVSYNKSNDADLDNAVVAGDPIMIVNVDKSSVYQTKSDGTLESVVAADFKVGDSSGSDANDIKAIFETNRINNNALTIKGIDIAWTKTMKDTETGSGIVKIWTAEFDETSGPKTYSYPYNYSLK